MAKERCVLAYSGGLDTSIILKWLIKGKMFDVTTVTADLGQKEDMEAVKTKALQTGASNAFVIGVKEEFITKYIFPAIRANLRYEDRYLLGTSLARPLTAKVQIDVAKKIGATILSHGATGKGNDQIRFEMAYLTLMPEARLYIPWKELDFLNRFKKGRDDMMEYAKAEGIPITQTKKEPWSNDPNIMHISYEAGILENPLAFPFERMFRLTKSPKKAPGKRVLLEIDFERGNPVRVRRILNWVHNRKTGVPEKIEYGEEYTNPLDLFVYLNTVAGENGVGRVDMVENRYVGIKSRGVYETPGATILQFAHKDLEGITLDREIMRKNQHTSIDLAERVYSGFWFSPERESMQETIDRDQKVVTGFVRVELYKGNITPKGRASPNSLYNMKMGSMHEEGGFDQTKSRGFIDVTAIRPSASEQRRRIMEE